MHRKDIELIAAAIKDAAKLESMISTTAGHLMRIQVAQGVANALQERAPSFDKELFLKACGVNLLKK